MKKILVTGSIAYDFIMTFNDVFAHHILPQNLNILNVSFTANKMSKNLGGTAGNISYGLSLLKEHPYIFGTVGKDFDEYKKSMDAWEIHTEYVHIWESEWTASAHIITDKESNQITAFYGGAMLKNDVSIAPILEKEQFDLAIVAADGKDGMLLHAKELKDSNIPFIYDPGQSLPSFQKDELRLIIQGAKIAIMNEYEKDLFLARTEWTEEELLNQVESLIITKGSHGSAIYRKNSEPIIIPIAKTDTVADPTGAGDAFRGGLIKGFVLDLSIEEACYLGSLIGTYAVEHVGTQSYSFTPEEFIARFRTNFGERNYLSKLFV